MGNNLFDHSAILQVDKQDVTVSLFQSIELIASELTIGCEFTFSPTNCLFYICAKGISADYSNYEMVPFRVGKDPAGHSTKRVKLYRNTALIFASLFARILSETKEKINKCNIITEF
jgi:hypothetical protein